MDHHRQLFTAWIALLLLCLAVINHVGAFNLTILHTNDIHARIEEMNKYNGQCSSDDATEGKCYGGLERLKSKIDELRVAFPNSVLLDAGDQYQGTLFFYVYRGKIMSHFMNVLGYDAMGLGNHEFDLGPSGLKPFVDNATFHILSTNANFAMTPGLDTVQKSVIVKVGGNEIGIIGYTTSDTATISNPGKVTFEDEIQSIQTQVDNLISKGVNKIIALGHAGYAKDMEIAKNVRGLDVIVGGHSNTFLYTGDAPAHEDPIGLYPTIIKNQQGHNVLVVQDYAYGKYLGFLQVDFDDSGTVTAWNGNPILMDKTVPKDPEVTSLINSYLPQVEKMKSEKVGQSLVHLQGDRLICRVRECNMGNLIAESMIRQNLRYADGIEWNHVSIALVNSGSIRASVSKGNIMTSDVLSVAPFGNTVDIAELTGQILLDVLEHSAAGWVDTGDYGGFLQMSGIRVVYDMRRKVGDRVVEALVLCAECNVPEFEPLNLTTAYKILMPSFMVAGGDKYTMIRDNVGNTHTIGDVDSQLLLDYIKENSPMAHGLDGRIRFLQDLKGPYHCIDVASAAISSFFTLIITFIAFIVIV